MAALVRKQFFFFFWKTAIKLFPPSPYVTNFFQFTISSVHDIMDEEVEKIIGIYGFSSTHLDEMVRSFDTTSINNDTIEAIDLDEMVNTASIDNNTIGAINLWSDVPLDDSLLDFIIDYSIHEPEYLKYNIFFDPLCPNFSMEHLTDKFVEFIKYIID